MNYFIQTLLLPFGAFILVALLLFLFDVGLRWFYPRFNIYVIAMVSGLICLVNLLVLWNLGPRLSDHFHVFVILVSNLRVNSCINFFSATEFVEKF